MKKTAMDHLILAKAMSMVLDVNTAFFVNYAKETYAINLTDNGKLLIQKVKKHMDDGIFVLDSPVFGEVRSNGVH